MSKSKKMNNKNKNMSSEKRSELKQNSSHKNVSSSPSHENVETVMVSQNFENSKNGVFGKLFETLGLKTKVDYTVCIIGVAIILALLVLAVMLFLGVFKTEEAKAATAVYYGREESDFSVSDISSSLEEQHKMSDDMDLDFDNAKFDFYCVTECEYSDASPLLALSLSNPSYNDYVLVFTITNGEGEVLFRSLGIKPGKMLDYVNFTRNIPYGENELKLYVTAFDTKERKDGTKDYIKVGNSIATMKMTHNASLENITQ